MIDCHPALIVRCASTDDVVAAVNFGRDHDLLVSVRGGSHSTPGYSTCDDGIVIDLGPMNRVTVDPERAHRARAGRRDLGRPDAATQEHGLAVTGGRVSDTGVGGLALGSGSGWLERMYGVTCESLLSAEVVTADGQRRARQRRREPRALLGPARRRRQLRRRDRVRVPPASGRPDRDGRDARVPARAGARGPAHLPRLHRAGPGRGRRRRGADHRPAGGVRSRGAARASRRWASCSSTSGSVEDGEAGRAAAARGHRPGRRHRAADAVRRRCSRCSTPGTRTASASTSRSTG